MNHTHQPCPFCGSSDAFTYNSENGLYRCFSCDAKNSTHGGSCFDGKTITKSKPKDEEDLTYMEVFVPDVYRGLDSDTLCKDGLVIFTKTDKGDQITFTYPEGDKFRKTWLDKKEKGHFSAKGKLNHFFGHEEYPDSGNTATIVEGEWDRYSVIQMMGDYPTFSVPSATPSNEFWVNAKKKLEGYEKIILSVDNDAPGEKLAEKFYRLFPGKVYKVDHGKLKDANDFLEAGKQQEYKRLWWNAKRLKPSTLISTPDEFMKLFNETPNYEYFETGIPTLDEKMLGIHKGAFTLVVAPTGIGKTEFMRYLEYQCLSTTNYTIATCHLEETPLRSYLGLISYELKLNVTRKEIIEENGLEQEFEEANDKLAGDDRLYQFQIRTTEGTDDLLDQIRFLVTAMGVDFVFFEPIQDIVSGDVNTKESLLTDLSSKLKRLAPEIDVGIVVIAHANEEGDPKYCRSIVQSAAYEIKLHREMDDPDPTERNRMHVSIGRKNRTGGGSGPCGSLLFDKDTYMLSPDIGEDKPDNVVGF